MSRRPRPRVPVRPVTGARLPPYGSMIRGTGAVLAVAALLAAAAGPARAAPTEAPGAAVAAELAREAVERLLAVSRIDADLASAVEGLAAQVDEDARARGVAEAQRARVVGLAERSYTVDAVRGPIVERLVATLEPGDVERLAHWYLSPLGQRTLEAEAAHELDDPAPFARFVESLATHPERDARLAAARALCEELRLVESVAAMQVEMRAATLIGLAATLPPSARPEIATELAALDGQRAVYEAELEDLLVAYVAFTYEDLTLVELDELLSFWRRPESRRMAEAMLTGMREGFGAASLAFGEGLGVAVTVAASSAEI